MPKKQRSVKELGLIAMVVTAVVIIVIVVASIVIPIALTVIGGGGGGGGGGGDTTDPSGTIETLQWDIFTDDFYAGGDADCTVAIYDPDTGVSLESGTTGSDGKWTSSGYFTSDKVYDLKFGNGTFVEYWELGVVVPRFVGTVLSGATHKSTFNVVDQGTFALAIAYGASRTAISSGGNYNQTTLGASSNFYITVRNTETESGFISSNNPIVGDGMDCNALLEIYVIGSDYQDVGWTNSYEEKNNGAQQSWYIPLSDTDIVYDLDADGDTVIDGERVFTIPFDFTDVAGDAVDVYFRLVLGTSIDYLDNHTGLPSSTYAYTYTTSAYFNLLD